MKNIVVSGLNTEIELTAVHMNAEMGPGLMANAIVMMKKNNGTAVVTNGQIA